MDLSILLIKYIFKKIRSLLFLVKNKVSRNMFFLIVKYISLKIISAILEKWNVTFLVLNFRCMIQGINIIKLKWWNIIRNNLPLLFILKIKDLLEVFKPLFQLLIINLQNLLFLIMIMISLKLSIKIKIGRIFLNLWAKIPLMTKFSKIINLILKD